MKYFTCYDSPIGYLLLISDEKSLLRVEFDCCSEEAFLSGRQEGKEGIPDVMFQTITWLNAYFSGENPGKPPRIELEGTPFQKEVWDVIKKIPYGQSMSYGDIAIVLAQARGVKKISAQAVGQAAGKNPVPILVPCHRVLGSKNKIAGYGGGLERKKLLLCLEQIPYKM